MANRIEGGKFELDGKTYTLAQNNGNNTLHGGVVGFDKKMWSVEKIHNEEIGAVAVTLKHVSEDGDEGFPGQLTTKLKISLSLENDLSFEYECMYTNVQNQMFQKKKCLTSFQPQVPPTRQRR